MKKLATALLLSAVILVGCTPGEQANNDISQTEYDLSEDATFNTEISGYYYSSPKEIMGTEYNLAYVLITDFKDAGFKKAIAANWGDNELINGFYPFQLGCFENGQIKSSSKIDDNTKNIITKSTQENPVALDLLFDKHPGTDQPCISLAQAIYLKNPTTNNSLQTYVNKEHGYSIELPNAMDANDRDQYSRRHHEIFKI